MVSGCFSTLGLLAVWCGASYPLRCVYRRQGLQVWHGELNAFPLKFLINLDHACKVRTAPECISPCLEEKGWGRQKVESKQKKHRKDRHKKPKKERCQTDKSVRRSFVFISFEYIQSANHEALATPPPPFQQSTGWSHYNTNALDLKLWVCLI